LALIGASIMFYRNVFEENNSGIATIIEIIGLSLISTFKYRLQLEINSFFVFFSLYFF